MDPTKVYHRNDDSAWSGNGQLAYVTGSLAGLLSQPKFAAEWQVEFPNGYAPVIDLVRPDGRRYRLTIAEVEDRHDA